MTVKDRILLHLLEYWGMPDRGEWPPAMTQAGISAAIGVSRGHVAVELPALLGWGLVDVRVSRVTGRPRRVKVYALTHTGGAAAGRLAAGLLRNTVTAVDDTGEWELPLDGIIQVHGVDMLSALMSMDRDGRIDLRALKHPSPEAAEEAPEEEEEQPARAGSEVPIVPWVPPRELPGTATIEPSPSPHPAAPVPSLTPPPLVVPPPQASVPQGPATSPADPAVGPPAAPVSPGPAQTTTPYPRPPEHRHPTLGEAPPPGMYYPSPIPPPAYYWNPLRRGTGRKPTPLGLAVTLGAGYALFMGAVFLLSIAAIGGSPGICLASGIPLLAFGTWLTWLGGRGLWALGGRRRVWVSATLCAYAYMVVVVACIFAYGGPALLDMLWASLVLGLPSLVLAAGANREVRRRGMLLLFVGPIVAVVFVGMALLEPGWGRTPAMALFGVEVGASWAFVGALMLHPHGSHGGVDRGALAIEGLSAGLAVLGLAWLLDDLDRGHATAPKAALVVLWVATAAWVVAARYVPALHARTPPLSAAYPVLTAASAVGLLVAGARFIVGGFNTVGLLIGIISVAMVAMVAPELRKAGRTALAATAWGCLVAAVTVMVLASLL